MKSLARLPLWFLFCILSLSSVAEDGPHLPFRNRKIVAFLDENIGKKVGGGSCWDLAQSAITGVRGNHPRGDVYAWGKELDIAKDTVMAGDVVQTFAKGKAPEGPHTALVWKTCGGTKVVLAEQNWNGQQFVTTREVDLQAVARTSDLRVYRPR